MRATVSLRLETPSLRYTEMAWVLTVFRETNNRSLISANVRWVGNSGSSRSSRGGQRCHTEHVASGHIELRAQLVGLVGQVAESGSVVLEVLELPRARRAPASGSASAR